MRDLKEVNEIRQAFSITSIVRTAERSQSRLECARLERSRIPEVHKFCEGPGEWSVETVLVTRWIELLPADEAGSRCVVAVVRGEGAEHYLVGCVPGVGAIGIPNI